MQPTLKQVEAFARAVHVPVGYLFLSEPPEEPIPIPDFRTVAGRTVRRPSPNLLDTIYACQERQSWYRDFVRGAGQTALSCIGSATLDRSPESVAAQMRETLGFDLADHQQCSTWTDALRWFIGRIEAIGVLVMVSGVVMSNNRRRLDVAEFRGFALSDAFAPLIFVNGTDTKAAQMFTLAHELAHLWLDASALSNVSVKPQSGFRREEIWCNAVAAELLVPLAALRDRLSADEPLDNVLSRLAQAFKVSKLVILRRLLDAGWIDHACFDSAWAEEIRWLQSRDQSTSGGDFYRTTLTRVGRRFTHALVVSTLEGQTLYRDAFRMLGIAKTKTFNQLGCEVGVMG